MKEILKNYKQGLIVFIATSMLAYTGFVATGAKYWITYPWENGQLDEKQEKNIKANSEAIKKCYTKEESVKSDSIYNSKMTEIVNKIERNDLKTDEMIKLLYHMAGKVESIYGNIKYPPSEAYINNDTTQPVSLTNNY